MNTGLANGRDNYNELLNLNTSYKQGYKNRVGRIGENLARKYLQKNGYFIWKSNWKTLAGELDIIAIDGKKLVFIEVKTRIDDVSKIFDPFEAVDDNKQEHIQKVAEAFIEKYQPQLSYKRINSYRFDIIGIILEAKYKQLWFRKKNIVHHKDAFLWK